MFGAGRRALSLPVASLLCVLVLLGPRTSYAAAAAVSAKDLSDIKGGILVKNGNQTSCELGVLDSKAAFVSADCISFSGSFVNKNVKYQVLLDSGANNKTASHNVTAIAVHPSYIPGSKANNIALLQYNTKSNVTYSNTSAISRNDWKELIYVRRVLNDAKANSWGDPMIRVKADSNDTVCSTMQPLYKANSADFTCDSALVAPPKNSASRCDVPYAMVYARVKGRLYQAGIQSHAAILGGNDICRSNQTRAYFTLFADYLTFADITLKRKTRFIAPSNATKPQGDPYYAMRQPLSSAPKGIQIVGGDLFLPKPAAPAPAPAPSPAPGKGLSKRSIIIIACCVSVGVPIITIAVFFFVRWYRGHVKRTRDPYRENARRHMLVHDLGGASLPRKGGLDMYYPHERRTRSSSQTEFLDYLGTPLDAGAAADRRQAALAAGHVASGGGGR